MDLPPPRTEQAVGAGDLLEQVLADLSRATSERDVAARAAALVADLLDADLVAVCEGTRVLGAVGAGTAVLPERGLARVVRDRRGSFAVPGVGRVQAEAVDVPGLAGASLVVGRLEGAVAPAPDPSTVAALSVLVRVLGLVVLGRRGMEPEHWLQRGDRRDPAERSRLQDTLRQREQVLATSVRFQRAVTSRRPLPELLLQIAAGTSELLGRRAVALVLADVRSRGELRVVAAVGRPALDPDLVLSAARSAGSPQEGPGPAAVPVLVDGRSVGALVVDTAGAGALDVVDATVLRAFAEHAGRALGSAGGLRAAQVPAADDLTGLPNRSALLQHLDVALRAGRADGAPAAVLLLDLDGFSRVAEAFGRAAADDVLARVARRLQRCLRAGDVVARLGGDEFALVLRDAHPHTAAVQLAERVHDALSTPLWVQGRAVRLSCSAGIAVADDVQPAAELLRRADTALHRASETGAGRTTTFVPGMADVAHLRRQLAADLDRAVADGEFELAWQPVVRLADGAVVQVEALLRWRHRVRGLLAPEAFLAGAEQSPALSSLWRWLVLTACEQVAGWRGRAPELGVSLTLSERHVLSGQAAADVVAGLRAARLAPSAVALHVPVSLLARTGAAADLVATRLEELRRTGVRIVVDGVGAVQPGAGAEVGTSGSLAPLRRLPVDGLVLDASLVAELDGPDAAPARAAVSTLCRLAQALDLAAVACGVERAEQVLALVDVGCTLARGGLLGTPRPAAQLGALLD
ncbi:putative bifunctional diguanylate cyclase/phosphodiesterase, partial [Kineococcus rubinsiae]|uniref:putative bifunctional diguanylate cyclase/phosphodiesterase n=1 Tax=Kineococcus rubinsiae TaxID=2609562 RepID=UPI001430D123